MTAKLVNLTRARKTRARDGKRRLADANAARHGLTRAERAALDRQADKAQTHLDQHRLEDDQT